MDALDRLQKIDRSTDIESFSIKLYFWSRSPLVLTSLALLIIGIGVGVGWLLNPPGKFLLTSDQLQAELAKPQPDAREVLELMEVGCSEQAAKTGATLHLHPVEKWLSSSKLAAMDKTVLLAFWSSLHEYEAEPNADLFWYAYQANAPRFANESIGDLAMAAKKTDKAVTYYTREGRIAEAAVAREKAVAVLLEKRDFSALKALLDTPDFKDQRKPEYFAQIAAAEHRWADLPAQITALELSLFKPLPTALAALAALAWFLIVLQSIQAPRAVCFRTIVPIIAIVAGMISTWPTLFAGLWQDEMWGLRHTGDMLGDARYFLLGVGVREELIKLAFFLPFLPMLLARKSRLEAVCIAGCVGLGFAAAENLIYFAQGGATLAMGRFLTANFFHTAATGLVGLSLFDALCEPRKKALFFPLTLVTIMLAHGLYDAFLGFTELRVFETLSGLVFMFTSLFFFRGLRPMRDTSTDHLNIAGTFIVGISVLIAAVFAITSAELGFQTAAAVLLVSAITLGVIFYMFYWQLGEGMSAVQDEARPNYNL